MKKVFLVSVWVCNSPKELEQHYFACRATGKRAAQNAAERKFKADGYEIDVCCAETDEYGNLIAADSPDELKAPILERIAKYKACIAETERLTPEETAKMDWLDCAWRLLDYHALTVAQKKIAALDDVK